jgi:hypothetical protein
VLFWAACNSDRVNIRCARYVLDGVRDIGSYVPSEAVVAGVTVVVVSNVLPSS